MAGVMRAEWGHGALRGVRRGRLPAWSLAIGLGLAVATTLAPSPARSDASESSRVVREWVRSGLEADCRAGFAGRDGNHDGALSHAEVPYLTPARFASLDRNHDGAIDWQEARPSETALADAAWQAEARLRTSYQELDLDHDGTLGRTEVAAIMPLGSAHPGPMDYEAFARALQSLDERPAAVPTATHAKNPVLMLPGFLMPSWSYVVLSKSLERAGYTHFYVLDGWPWFSDIREYAEQARFQAERLRRETGRPQVELLAHSMGGLVGRTMIEDLGEEEHVNHYVSFGTPHHGTVVGRLADWYAMSAAEMEPGSPFLKTLNLAEGRPSSVKYTSVHAEFDEIVLPHTSVDLAGADNPEVHNAFHIGIVYMREAARLAVDALAR